MLQIFSSSHKSAFILIANLALADALLVIAEFIIVNMEKSSKISSSELPEHFRLGAVHYVTQFWQIFDKFLTNF